MKRILLLISIALFIQCSDDENSTPQVTLPITVTDADGNVYNTITAGNQVWMLENLKTTKYNDGTPINEFSFGNDWHNGNTQIDYYQWANTDDLNNVHTEDLPFDYYGALYNHYAIETGKLAPQGWRIPTQQDFIELENYLSNNGHQGNEALALKSSSGWLPSSGNGTDAIGFKALPNGYVSAFGTSTLAEGICTWATSNTNDTNGGQRVLVQLFDQNEILYSDNPIQIGFGVRCIKE